MRSLFSNFAVLAMSAVVAGVAISGCSSNIDDNRKGESARTEPTGNVGLNLQPVPGLDVSEVHYVVTQGATVVSEGDLPTPGTEDTFSFGIPLPVGTGYTLTLSGESDAVGDSITCTGTFGPFDVTANTSTLIEMILLCADTTNGQIITDVTVETEACPTLLFQYAVATPSTAILPDGTIAVFSSATDTGGLPVTYSWSVADTTVGDFTNPNAQNTTFNCNGAGDDVIITVTADNGACDTTLQTKISCTSLTCGNGVLDPGEDCDPAIGPCPADCTVSCGDGNAELPVEECDPPAAGICDDTCQNIPFVCGDTFVQPGEECEPPNTATCDANCQDIGMEPDVCGDGAVTGAELCDPPFSAENCGSDCMPIDTQACIDCATANCSGAESCVGSPSPVQCRDTLDCVRDSGCAEGGFALFCYCGAVSATECDTGAAAGACRAEIETGLGSTDPIFIQNNLYDITLSAGRAMGRVDCELSAGCGVTCTQP